MDFFDGVPDGSNLLDEGGLHLVLRYSDTLRPEVVELFSRYAWGINELERLRLNREQSWVVMDMPHLSDIATEADVAEACRLLSPGRR